MSLPGLAGWKLGLRLHLSGTLWIISHGSSPKYIKYIEMTSSSQNISCNTMSALNQCCGSGYELSGIFRRPGPKGPEINQTHRNIKILFQLLFCFIRSRKKTIVILKNSENIYIYFLEFSKFVVLNPAQKIFKNLITSRKTIQVSQIIQSYHCIVSLFATANNFKASSALNRIEYMISHCKLIYMS